MSLITVHLTNIASWWLNRITSNILEQFSGKSPITTHSVSEGSEALSYDFENVCKWFTINNAFDIESEGLRERQSSG